MPRGHISNQVTATTYTIGNEWGSPFAIAGDWQLGGFDMKQEERGIHPRLYFKYIKSKFGLIEKSRLDNRIKKLEKAFDHAMEHGQNALAEKFLARISVETREAFMYAKGVRKFIVKPVLDKHKRNIRGGHISDTRFEDFTRVVPDRVLKKKKEVEECFDEFWVYHYWNPEAGDVKTMDHEEREKMKDPVLFGKIKECDRMYFIAEWEDEYCDLSFEEIIDAINGDGGFDDPNEYILSSKPDFSGSLTIKEEHVS